MNNTREIIEKLNRYKSLPDGDERTVLGQELKAWRDEHRTRQADQFNERVDRLYSGLENARREFGNLPALDSQSDPDETLAGGINQGLVAKQWGKTEDEVAQAWPVYRAAFSQQAFGKIVGSDKELYGLIQGKVEDRKKRKEAVTQLHLGAVAQALEDTLAGKETMLTPGFRAWADANRELVDGKEEGKYLTSAFKIYRKTLSDIAPYRETASQGWQLLTKFTEGQQSPEDVVSFAYKLTDIEPAERKNIYRYIALAARAKQVDTNAIFQFSKNIGESVSRGFGFAENYNVRQTEQAIASRLKQVRDGVQVWIPEGGSIADAQVGNTPDPLAVQQEGAFRLANPEEKLQLIQGYEQGLEAFQIGRELRAVASKQVDPIRPLAEDGSLLGTIERGGYGLAGSLGIMGVTALPGVGLMLGGMAIADEELDRLLLENPDMDRDAARTLAGFSAAGQSVIEKLQIQTLAGRLPITGKFIEDMKPGLGKTVSRIALATGEQNIQEGLQDAISEFLPAFAAAVREDMPDVDIEAKLQDYVGSRPEVFFAVLPLALIGGGVASMRDFKEPREVVSPAMLEAAGFDAQQRNAILSERTPEAIQAKIQEQWDKRTPENIERGKRSLEAILARTREVQDNSNSPTVETITKPDGSREFSVTLPNGERFASPDLDAVTQVVKQFAVSELTNTNSGIAEIASYIQDVNQRAGRGEDIQQLVLNEAPQTLLDEYNANPTAENLDRLFDTIRFFGGEITEKNQLSQYVVRASNRGFIKDGIYRSIIKVHEGSDARFVMRDFAQDNIKRTIAQGDTDIAKLRAELENLRQVKGFENIRTESDTDVIESFSDAAVAYFYGQMRQQEIPRGLRAFFVQMARIVREIFKRAYNLRRAVADGTVSEDFRMQLAQSVGVDLDSRVSEVRDRTTAEIVNFSVEPTQRETLETEIDRLESEAADIDLDDPSTWPLPAVSQGKFGNETFSLNRAEELADAMLEFEEGSKKYKAAEQEYNQLKDRIAKLVKSKEARAQELRDQLDALEESEDVNYSVELSAMDARYMELAQDPEANRDELQAMVDVAAKAAGLLELWTGRKYKPDNENIVGSIWDRPTWFTNQRRVAVRYARGSYDPKPNPQKWVRKFYANIKNPFTFERSKEVYKYLDAALPEEAPFTPEEEIDNENAADSGVIRDALQRLGFDGVHYTGDDMTGDGDKHESWLVFNANQIKSTEPVTYDESGNIIPLSRRFNPESDNINYSVEKADPSGKLDAFMQKNPLARQEIYKRAKAKFEQIKARRGTSADPNKKFANLLQSMGELDAILSVLPASIRGKIGGFTSLANMAKGTTRGNQQETIDRFLSERIDMVDKELERFLRKEYRDRIEALLDKAKPKRGDNGVQKSTIGPEAQDYVNAVLRATYLDEDGAAERMQEIEAALDAGNQNPDLVEEWAIVNMFGDIKNRSAATLLEGLETLQSIIKTGRREWRIQQEARLAEIREKRDELRKFYSGANVAVTFDAEHKSAATKFFESVKAYGADHLSFEQFLHAILPNSPLAVEFSERMRKADMAEQTMRLRDIEAMQKAIADAAKAAGIKPGRAILSLKEMKEGLAKAIVDRQVKAIEIDIDKAEQIVRGEADPGELKPQDIEQLREALATRKEQLAEVDFESMSAGNDNARMRRGPAKVKIYRVIKPGRETRVNMSHAQGIQLLLSWNQPDVRQKLERGGWLEEGINEIKASIAADPVALAVLDYLRNYYANNASRTNPVYQRIFGMNIPQVENYAPTRFRHTQEGTEIGPDNMPIQRGSTPGFIKSRVTHNAQVQPVDALQVYFETVSQTSHWSNFAELARDFRAVFADADIRDAMRVQLGDGAVQTLNHWITMMETRGNDRAREHAWMNKFLGNAISAQSIASLGGNLRTLAMQVDSAMRFMFALDPKEIVTAFKDPQALIQSMPKVWFSDAVQNRLKGGMNPEVQFLFTRTAQKPNLFLKVGNLSMQPINYLDAVFTTMGSAVVYRSAYNDVLKAGGNEKLAEKAAMDAMGAAIYRFSQPTGLGNRSPVELSGSMLNKVIMMFLSDARLKSAIMLDASIGLATGRGSKATHIKNLLLVEAMAAISWVVGSAYRDEFTDDEDEEIWTLQGLGLALATAPFSGLFLAGTITQGALSTLLGERWFSPARDPLVNALESGIRAANNIEDLWAPDNMEDFLKELNNLSRAASIHPAPAAFSATLNLIKPISGAAQNAESNE